MSPAVRLFCLPYSGASAWIFKRWSRRLPAWIEVRPVELPGRGTRMDEPLAGDPHALARRLAGELRDELALPYALLGHSLGALLAYELAHARRDGGAPPPVLLIASGAEAPSVRDDSEWRRPRSDAELMADLRDMNGTPEEALASRELMDEVRPVLRADFLMCGAYAYRPRAPLPCPIGALGGTDDDTPLATLRAWERETSAGFSLDLFAGGHFFIHESQAEVLDLIARRLAPLVHGETRAYARGDRPHARGDRHRNETEERFEMSSFEIRPLVEGTRLPMLFEAAGSGRPALGEALPAMREAIAHHLRTGGGALFRGFALDGVDAFRAFAADFGHPLLTYEFGSTPRSQVSSGVYTSTEYPAHQHIPLHNEQSYTRDWPMKIWFYCVEAAPEGGETPIADSRAIYAAMPPAIRDAFVAKGLMYVRNYGYGLDVPWSQVFGTQDRGEVEAYCAAHRIACEWKEDGELRTRQTCQAVATHPVTGERVWFNQAHLFHVSGLEPEVRESLLDIVEDEAELPRNVLYGDGTPIEDATLATVRSVLEAHKITFPWQSGDVVMLDNMLTAHARAPFKGPRKVIVAMAEAHASH